jgi:hypothetical protein
MDISVIAYLSFFFQTLVNYLSNQESHSNKKWSSTSQLEDYKFDALAMT